MMKRFLPLVLLLAVIAFPACFLHKNKKTTAAPVANDGVTRKYTSQPVKKPVTVQLSDGLQYTITSKGSGPAIKTGDRVSVLYTGKFTNDTIFDASALHGNVPFTFKLGKHEVIPGWDSVMCHLHAGDKATMHIPPQYGYGSRPKGKIPGNSELIFDVEVLDVILPPAPWDAKGKDTITTPSGLKIVMFETNKDNAMPSKGQNVTVDYSGFLLDNSMFDSSVERGQPFSFPLGMGRVIKGWDEGIALLHKGDKAKFIIPYQLAYGEQGHMPVIPPKATLVFDVHLIDFN